MIEPVDLFAIVLALAVVIGSVNHLWIKLPAAVGMLVGSLVVSLLVVASDRVFHLHVMGWLRGTLRAADLSHFFLDGMLALLLYAGSLHVNVAELRRRGWVILLLATASVVISTLIFGVGMWLLFGAIGLAVPLAWCFVLGAILAPTDAVVVENLLAQVSMPAGLRAAIVGESLFNDGAGVVLFLLALGVIRGGSVTLGHGVVFIALLREIAGGALLGFAAGWLAALLIRHVRDDEGLQLLISLALALGCYRLAGEFALSGPIAVVTAGLCMASPSPRFGMASDSRTVVIRFWSLLDQLLNTMLFLLIGLQILGLIVTPAQLVPILFAVPLAVLSRLISVAVPLTLTREKWRDKARAAAVLTWAGLRGGISIALALTLPEGAWRTELLVATYAVVVFTIVVQGLTISRLLRTMYASHEPKLNDGEANDLV
jgi:Na+:H+ antiporter